MIFVVVALPDVISADRQCARQGDKPAGVATPSTDWRFPSPGGGANHQTVQHRESLRCTRLETALPCIAASDLYTDRPTDRPVYDHQHAPLTSAYGHHPTGCKPTAILTTGNTDTLLSTLAEEKKNREKRRIRFYYCPSSTREQEESAARDNTFNRYSLLPPPFVSRIFSNLDDKLGGNETKKRASIEEEEEDAADTRQIRCEIGIARMRTLRNRRFNLTVRSWCAPLSWSVGVAGRSRVGFADHDDGRS